MKLTDWKREVLTHFHISGVPLSIRHIAERTGYSVIICHRVVSTLAKMNLIEPCGKMYYSSWILHYKTTPLGIEALFNIEKLRSPIRQMTVGRTHSLLRDLYRRRRTKQFEGYAGIDVMGKPVYLDHNIIF